MTPGRAPREQGAGTPWLSADELETWHALNLLLARLPAVLGEQLHHDSDLSMVEYYVLAGLSDQPGHTIRMSSLAALTNAELSRLSHMIRRLERRGFVQREPDPDDGRYTLAVLTDDGRRHLEGAAPAHVTEVRRRVFDVLDTDHQHALRAAARQILAQLDPSC